MPSRELLSPSFRLLFLFNWAVMFALFPGMSQLSHAVMSANDPLQAEMTFGMGTNILIII
jgi:hypothetical protein